MCVAAAASYFSPCICKHSRDEIMCIACLLQPGQQMINNSCENLKKLKYVLYFPLEIDFLYPHAL
jgi:hypothetical protein